MREIVLTKQNVNACTLISLAVINAILSYPEQELEYVIEGVQQRAETQYRDLLEQPGGQDKYGAGLSEAEAQERYFQNVFAQKAVQADISKPADRDVLIRELIQNRDSLKDLPDVFFDQNGELLGNLTMLLPEGAPPVDWLSVSEEDLKAILLDNSKERSEDFPIQLQTKLASLENAGITLSSNGHTVSVTKKGNSYYFYDSAAGNLRISEDAKEMAEQLALYFQNSLNINTYTFTKRPEPQKLHREGQLTTNEKLNRTTDQETPAEQAERVFGYLLQRLGDNPDNKIGLIFSANNHQAEALHTEYVANDRQPDFKLDEPEILPDIGGGGQAKFVGELIALINNQSLADPTFSGKIRILPIATSLKGGTNRAGNTVNIEMINRDLDVIQRHLLKGYDVIGLPYQDGGFAIGGNISRFWYQTSYAAIKADDKLLSQGEYVQRQLRELIKNPHYERLAYYKDQTADERFQQFKDSLNALKSDTNTKISEQELHILDTIHSELASIRDVDELLLKVKMFKESDKYRSLESFMPSLYKTQAVKVFNKMVDDFIMKLENSPTSRPG